jgi:hypothetical protein
MTAPRLWAGKMIMINLRADLTMHGLCKDLALLQDNVQRLSFVYPRSNRHTMIRRPCMFSDYTETHIGVHFELMRQSKHPYTSERRP